jgi:hypothetical protein
MLSELTPTDWAVQQLLADQQLTALIGDRIDADDDVPPMSPEQDNNPSSYFPRIVYGGTPHGEEWATMLILGWGEFLFRVIMREDALPEGADFKSYTGEIAQHIERVLVAANNPGALGGGQIIHGATVTDLHAPALYGPRDLKQRICERGRFVRIDWS